MASVALFCSGAPEITDLMAIEASSLGAAQIREEGAGIACSGSLETAMRLCLWSRLANKVQLTLISGEVETTNDLYDLARSIDWSTQFRAADTFAVFATMRASQLCPPNFAAVRVKDAIADQFRDATGTRPNVDTKDPKIRLHLHVQRSQATISFDLSGESLHRRGYRLSGTDAMLKETVAASLLIRSGWPEMAADGAPFIDPMCGSGTVAIEAAHIAGDRAPGLERDTFGFESWVSHDPDVWKRIKDEAEERWHQGRRRIPPIAAFDHDPGAIRVSRENAERAGVADAITFRTQPITRLAPEPEMKRPGFVAIDPPYGKRTGSEADLGSLYESIGASVKAALPGWRGALLSADRELSKRTGLWADRTNTLHNGALTCMLAQFEIFAPRQRRVTDPLEDEYREIFANRLRKNIRSLRKWREREGISCYRLYDADVPEFAVAIDVYQDRWVNVQEYAPPSTVAEDRAELRTRIILDTIPDVLGLDPESVFYKSRERQRGGDQYERTSEDGTFYEVSEGGLRFLVHFSSRIDTGLFLDHRIMRDRIRHESRGKRVLNLFSYTGSASIYAADGGAAHTTSVDLSNTYSEWAKANFELNGLFDQRHEIVRDEVRGWLGSGNEQFDLIFLDPPTFSRSKRFKGTFQVQRDYPDLVSAALGRLDPEGTLYFSTNFTRFAIDASLFPDYEIEDISEETIPFDFRRNKRIHSVFRFTRRPPNADQPRRAPSGR